MVIVQAIERAFDILGALAAGPARTSDLAAAVGLPKSTVARLLVTLERVGAVERDVATNLYRIGEVMRQLAPREDDARRLVAAVRPHLHQLSEALGEAAGFSVPEGYAMHYLVQVDSPRPVQVRDFSGSSAPMHVVPAGLCLMAAWPEAELARYLSRPLERYTPRTVVEPAHIRQRVRAVREAGHAWLDEEFAEGLSSVAAPVLDASGRTVGALTVHGPTYRFPGPGQRDRVGALVRGAADRFSWNRLAS